MRPRRLRLAALVAAAAVLSAACSIGPLVTGSGTLVETRPDVEAFSKLVVGSAFEVTLRLGDEPALVLVTDDNVTERIEVVTTDQTLSIGLDGAVRDATLEADLTLPADALTSIALNGAASLTATEPLTAPALQLAASGASRLFAVVASAELDISAEGASVVNAEGSATSLTADASGASTVRLAGLEAGSARVTAEGASRVDVTVTGDLVVRAGGASTVRYAGTPSSVDRDVSGASSVEAE